MILPKDTRLCCSVHPLTTTKIHPKLAVNWNCMVAATSGNNWCSWWICTRKQFNPIHCEVAQPHSNGCQSMRMMKQSWLINSTQPARGRSLQPGLANFIGWEVQQTWPPTNPSWDAHLKRPGTNSPIKPRGLKNSANLCQFLSYSASLFAMNVDVRECIILASMNDSKQPRELR